MQQGSLANSSGNTLEQTIIATLSSKGFAVLQYRDWQRAPQKYGSELLLRNVPYRSIYGHAAKTEFVVRSERYQLNVRVECKWQQSSGSVDEKFPYLYINCLEGMPEDHVIIVLDGGGAKPGSVEWLRHACANKLYMSPSAQHKRIDVMSLSEFLIWANKTFR